jgi:hypothetical protein
MIRPGLSPAFRCWISMAPELFPAKPGHPSIDLRIMFMAEVLNEL